ncbi:MAG: ferritin-like domain-containing protein [Microcoleaceae cyanobacterium]
MMNYMPTVSGFNLLSANSNHKLNRVFRLIFGHEESANTYELNTTSLPWNSTYFRLDQVRIFQESTLQEQQSILKLANQSLLEEAYFIEKAGMGYMAKMVLLADTLEERMLYSQFSADEANHLAQIRRFFPSTEPTQPNNIFLNFLADLVEHSDKTILLFVLQVVLEGWSLSHYRQLAKYCQNPQVGQIFQNFLQAEAYHHTTGVALFQKHQVSLTSQTILVEILSQFLNMIQAGPQGILATIKQVKGDLSQAQKLQILQDLDAKSHSQKRLNLLRSLMNSSASQIVQDLEEHNLFQPFSLEYCVSLSNQAMILNPAQHSPIS